MYDFLTAHDSISGGDEKECHYFSLNFRQGDAWYLEKFRSAPEAQYYLDASPTYFDLCLQHPIADRIREFSPGAKIIIMIRNPIDRAVSHFNHLKKFNKVAALESLTFDDLANRDWPIDDNNAELERIRGWVLDFSMYHEKIDLYCKVFGADNVIVIHNDDLRDYGAEVMRQVFEFLKLDTPLDTDFSQQKYVHGSGGIPVSQENYLSLLSALGRDYYLSCTSNNVTRPVSRSGQRPFNQPKGALVDDVAVGEDGWLFLARGSNDVLRMYTEDNGSHAKISNDWLNVVKSRAEKVKRFGAQYIHVMVPEKMTVLGAKLGWPLDFKRSRGATFNKMATADIQPSIIDLVGYFCGLPNPETLYHKTDSHWNSYGAFAACQLIFANLGLRVRNELLSRQKVSGDIVLDLGGKLPNSPSEYAIFINFRGDSEVVSDEGLVRYKKDNNLLNESSLHVGSFIRFSCPGSVNPQRVMIFGDSFSEFRDHLLTGIFSESFRETYFVWSTSIDYEACERFQPDFVFCVMTERFMERVPFDDFNHVQYAEEKMKSLLDKEA